uniref:Uncharacterized protein n=1 Tax=Anguilla anguilla TaxID=7936 RepID=A0A0E9PGL3_ANGAN
MFRSGICIRTSYSCRLQVYPSSSTGVNQRSL